MSADASGRVSLNELFEYLGKSCNAVLIEAGATLAGSVIAQGYADELILYQAMKILGSAGRNLLTMADHQVMSDVPKITLIDERKVGVDTRLTLAIRS